MMEMTIKECLELSSFAAANLVSAEENVDNRIKSISVMDSTNVIDAVKYNGIKDQLVLTAFAGIQKDVVAQRQVVMGLHKKEIAGLVIFCREKEMPEVDESVINIADNLGLPIIVMDEEVGEDYTEVIQEVGNRLNADNNFDNSLINNAIYHLLNFEKYSSFQVAMRETAINNDIQVALFSEDFNPVFRVETRKVATMEQAVRIAREYELGKSKMYQLIDVNGVLTYWGKMNLKDESYYLLIVDNEDNYSSIDISKLAELIEIAMVMWKFAPDRDAKSEFLKALVRNNKNVAFSIKDEAQIKNEDIISVFYAKNIDSAYKNSAIHSFEDGKKLKILCVEENEETHGLILRPQGSGKNISELKKYCVDFYEKLKACDKGVRAFNAIDVNGIEGAADAFRLINESWTFVESVFPHKRVFSKYELALVNNCVKIAVQGGSLKKTYYELLSPFKKELGANKARQLTETLETFVLDAGLNVSRTSKFLGVHANTVQYRLKRINEILCTDITGNRIIPGITVSLALKRLEKLTN